MLGAEGRYGVGLALPHAKTELPWATVVINATGCLAIGVLMVILLELTSPHRLARPFLGVGVLGGYTTYSTFAVDTERLVSAHRPLVALGYVAVTLGACAVAVFAGAAVMRALGDAVIGARVRRRRRSRSTG